MGLLQRNRGKQDRRLHTVINHLLDLVSQEGYYSRRTARWSTIVQVEGHGKVTVPMKNEPTFTHMDTCLVRGNQRYYAGLEVEERQHATEYKISVRDSYPAELCPRVDRVVEYRFSITRHWKHTEETTRYPTEISPYKFVIDQDPLGMRTSQPMTEPETLQFLTEISETSAHQEQNKTVMERRQRDSNAENGWVRENAELGQLILEMKAHWAQEPFTLPDEPTPERFRTLREIGEWGYVLGMYTLGYAYIGFLLLRHKLTGKLPEPPPEKPFVPTREYLDNREEFEKAGGFTLFSTLQQEMREAGDQTVLITETPHPDQYMIKFAWDLVPAEEGEFAFSNWKSKQIDVTYCLGECFISPSMGRNSQTSFEGELHIKTQAKNDGELSLEEKVRTAIDIAKHTADFRNGLSNPELWQKVTMMV